MAKIATDISQSKKLAKLLPLESADMFYADVLVDDVHKYNLHPLESYGFKTFEETNKRTSKMLNFIPCWSLAALLEQLKSEIILENKQILFLHFNKYNDINYEIRYTNSWSGEVLITKADNHVDACVSMIEKLYGLNLL